MKFADFHLPYGYPLQVEIAGDEEARYVSRLIGCLPGKAVIISSPFANGREQEVRVGDSLTVRCMTGRGICHFSATAIGTAGAPIRTVFLQYPKNTELDVMRNAERVEARTPVVVNVVNRPAAVAEGFIRDISITGARLELEQPIADIGEGIAITADLSMEDLTQSLRTTAIVRNRLTPQGKKNVVNFGVEFTEKRDEKKWILFAYVNHLLAKRFIPNV